jgi:hypothetical protein
MAGPRVLIIDNHDRSPSDLAQDCVRFLPEPVLTRGGMALLGNGLTMSRPLSTARG